MYHIKLIEYNSTGAEHKKSYYESKTKKGAIEQVSKFKATKTSRFYQISVRLENQKAVYLETEKRLWVGKEIIK